MVVVLIFIHHLSLSFHFVDITKIGGSLQGVNDTSNTLKLLATELNNTINSINSKIKQAEADCNASAALRSSSLCDDIGSNLVTTNIDYNQFPNVDDEFASVDGVIKKNLTAQIQEVRENPNLFKISLNSVRDWITLRIIFCVVSLLRLDRFLILITRYQIIEIFFCVKVIRTANVTHLCLVQLAPPLRIKKKGSSNVWVSLYPPLINCCL